MASKRTAIKLSVSIDLNDVDQDVVKEVRRRSVDAMRDCAKILHEALVLVLDSPGSGRWYPSKRRDGTKHQASAPGESPAPDRGKYRGSFRISVYNLPTQAGFALWSNLWDKFGRRLELGGVDSKGIYIAPRPHIMRAFEMARSRMQRRLDQL